MVLYNKVSVSESELVDKNRNVNMKFLCINGTTIANASLISKTQGMTNNRIYHITNEVSERYASRTAKLNHFESKKSKRAELLPDFC